MSTPCGLPIIADPEKDLSGCCVRPAGLPELDRIHRTLPVRPLPAGDFDVLQDETGAAFNDEIDNSFLYDDFFHVQP